MRIKRSMMIAPLLTVGLAAVAYGQEVITISPGDPGQAAKHRAEIALLRNDDEGEPGQEPRQKVVLDLVTSDSPVVKEKPYSAEASTETVQTLGDGNRIVNRTVSKIYRDSQGRTRREQTFGSVDPSNSAPHEVKIFIDDPVSGSSYVVDPGEKSARQLPRTRKFMDELNAEQGDVQPGSRMHIHVKVLDDHAAGSGMQILALPKLDEKRAIVKEDLGKRTVEGVECTGTLQTITIPAGEVGNERPIQIVTETWFAPAIDAVVQSSTNDPRFGQTTYQLHNVQLGAPQHDLFVPPADYRIEGKQ
jgi:hypothetical protein